MLPIAVNFVIYFPVTIWILVIIPLSESAQDSTGIDDSIFDISCIFSSLWEVLKVFFKYFFPFFGSVFWVVNKWMSGFGIEGRFKDWAVGWRPRAALIHGGPVTSQIFHGENSSRDSAGDYWPPSATITHRLVWPWLPEGVTTPGE